jgi:hypothetical protein
LTNRILTNATEPIAVTVLDANGDPITGLTNVKVRIRRQSDGFYLDWSDDTFKAGGAVTTLLQPLTEVSTFDPGDYHLSGGWDTSAITNSADDDVYFLTAVQDGAPQNADNLPAKGEVAVGNWVDMVELSKQMLINELALTDGAIGNWVLLGDDDATPRLTFDVTDKDGNPITLPVGAPARRTRGT